MTEAAEIEKKMYLPEIVAFHRQDVERRKAEADFAALELAASAHEPRGFARALREKAKTGPAVIAEIKKASPSKGLIRENLDPTALAIELEAAGAAVLSVLTDEPYFQGSLGNLRAARAACKLPLLRKDFMVDPFQVLEARANGADAILLIVAALNDIELRTLREEARRYGLDVLCEVHDAEEVERARALDCECVGVNTRDLKTFHVSLDRAIELSQSLPADVIRVAESGITGREDVQRMRAAGFGAFLIGESLMRAERPGEALKALLS
ncbi:indole-3-glycerol phosphate synthase TrpC [Granulicella cerasi]|uniref:Indole-3-glycerol phosphate synthase n=1 Tax=Granulicella cerasi TaxID=741063 RepID=A0ABW1Z9U4_9BACT|nr:indole-3-glycerol phosphate synthase TrpC [Granulicella cerasi]